MRAGAVHSAVIARSGGSEAIQLLPDGLPDCFMEPVPGQHRIASKTRGSALAALIQVPAMTARVFFCSPGTYSSGTYSPDTGTLRLA